MIGELLNWEQGESLKKDEVRYKACLEKALQGVYCYMLYCYMITIYTVTHTWTLDSGNPILVAISSRMKMSG